MERIVAVLALALALLFLAVAGAQFVSMTQANFTPLPELPTPIFIREDGTIENSIQNYGSFSSRNIVWVSLYKKVKGSWPNDCAKVK